MPKNTLYLMGYISNDKFNLDGDTTYAYSNRNANLKWKHNFSNQFLRRIHRRISTIINILCPARKFP